MKIHHIGIAVESLRTAVPLFERLLGRAPDTEEVVEDQKVRIAVFTLGGSRIELLEATSPESPIAHFISKRGQGVHHVALTVASLSGVLAQLEAVGVRLIDREPHIGAGKERIAFLHPASSAGVLIELVEEI
jgi:methylmalonyl-CoA/ethylmalonyl-CoA epimerase